MIDLVIMGETVKALVDPDAASVYQSWGEASLQATNDLERLALIAHHDAIVCRLHGIPGAIRLSQWMICWSVKFYNMDGKRQFTLIDGVDESQARAFFSRHQTGE